MAGLALFIFVALSGDDIPRSVNGLCSGLGGALIGLGGSGLIIPLAMRTMSPEERREVERGETDERNVYIRARARPRTAGTGPWPCCGCPLWPPWPRGSPFGWSCAPL